MTTTFTMQGYDIDLDVLYRAMDAQAQTTPDGERLFNGNLRDVRAVKRLLNDLFGVPVLASVHPLTRGSAASAGIGCASWAGRRSTPGSTPATPCSATSVPPLT